jgi:uncharacterized membrane protein
MSIMRFMKQEMSNKRISEGNRKHRGQALLTVALMLPVLCGIMGLAIDVGFFHHLKRRMQTAADAAALAGAHEVKKRRLLVLLCYKMKLANDSEVLAASARTSYALKSLNSHTARVFVTQ